MLRQHQNEVKKGFTDRTALIESGYQSGNMLYVARSVLLFAVSMATLGLEAQTRGVHTDTLAKIEITYCGATPKKPPLEELHFRVYLRNETAYPEWVLLPNGFYSAATRLKEGAGISTVEVLSDKSHNIKLLKFLGSTRLQPEVPNDAGGFQALRVSSAASVTLPLKIDFWGRPRGPLPITATIARDIHLRSKPVDQYFRMPLMSTPNSVAHGFFVAEHWNTRDLTEVPVKIGQMGKVTIRNAFASTCDARNK